MPIYLNSAKEEYTTLKLISEQYGARLFLLPRETSTLMLILNHLVLMHPIADSILLL